MEIVVDRGRIRALRKQKLWTQEQMAEKSGVHARTIQRIEKDGLTSMQSCTSIAEALGVDPATLTCATAEVASKDPETWADRWLCSARDKLGIQHNERIPTSLKVVLLLWFVIGAADIFRAFDNLYIYFGVAKGVYSFSFLWLLPGLFNLYVFYQLLALRPVWRQVAVVYNWVFMGGALVAMIIVCNALFEPPFNSSSVRPLLESSQFGPAPTLLLYLVVAALVFFICLWQNMVLARADIRNLFARNASNETVSGASPRHTSIRP